MELEGEGVAHLVSPRVMQTTQLSGRVQQFLQEVNKHLEIHHRDVCALHNHIQYFFETYCALRKIVSPKSNDDYGGYCS